MHRSPNEPRTIPASLSEPRRCPCMRMDRCGRQDVSVRTLKKIVERIENTSRAAEPNDEFAPSKPNAHVPLPVRGNPYRWRIARPERPVLYLQEEGRVAPRRTAGLYEASHTI